MKICPICKGEYEQTSGGLRYFHGCPDGRNQGGKFKRFRMKVDENRDEKGKEKSPAIEVMAEIGEFGLFISEVEEVEKPVS